MFDQFKNRMSAQGGQMGKALKRQSDMIMDATFHRDIAFRTCYIQEKDTIFPEQTIESYLKAKSVYAGKTEYDPSSLSGFQPIDCKYLVHTYTSISKPDAVDYYLQFRPNAHGSNPNIRVGAFVFIPDDLGIYNLWMIVQRDDRPQFPQFYVLRCDFLAKWCIEDNDVPNYEGIHVDTGTYFTWCVARSQSSYNSGVWTDYLVVHRSWKLCGESLRIAGNSLELSCYNVGRKVERECLKSRQIGQSAAKLQLKFCVFLPIYNTKLLLYNIYAEEGSTTRAKARRASARSGERPLGRRYSLRLHESVRKIIYSFI